MLKKLGVIAALFFLVGCAKQPEDVSTKEVGIMSGLIQDVKWLGHAGIKITGDKVVYMDPYKIKGDEPADIILITHEHYDHCSPDDVAKILKNDTAIITVADCQSKLNKLDSPMTLVKPGDRLKVKGIRIEVTPAYNIDKQFHPKENSWVGFVVEMNGKRYYHAGDTDFIPEMAQLKNIDVAFLPIGGTYTMDAAKAANAANTIKAKITVPIHYGSIVGSREDAERFKRLVNGEVIIFG